VPTIEELRVAISGTEQVHYDTARAFYYVQDSYYWSSSAYTDTSPFSWYGYLRYGIDGIIDKGTLFYVWPVRTGQ